MPLDHISNSWKDYWDIFEKLISILQNNDKGEIALEFKEAQKNVNGLTDGWYQYKFALEGILKSQKSKLSKEEIDITKMLVDDINTSLNRKPE